MITISVKKSTYHKNRLFRAQHDCKNIDAQSNIIIGTKGTLPESIKGGAVLSSNESVVNQCIEKGIGVIGVDEIPPLDDGDIFLYSHAEKVCRILYQAQSDHNILFLTNRCNSNCIMCPQPPAKDKIDHMQLAYDLISLIISPPKQITITGGEPTLHGQSLIELVSHLRSMMPDTELNLLSNGRKFTCYRYASELYFASSGKMLFAVPLNADSPKLHDEIVDVNGAFKETVSGLMSLAALNAMIELRIVLLKVNVSRLPKLISWAAMNLPFINHIAIMSAEPEGYARKRWPELWIDPINCHDHIKTAVKVALRTKTPLRFYNFQICTLPRIAWEFSYCSISDWKRIYLFECNKCRVRSRCGGFFQSQDSSAYISRGIAPVK